ncbi:MAG: ABC transporter ATP-binding protein [Bradymonadales bacterium]|nr:MAG: ABC transporter ATP-binding protein [Bradymonadales bacterium]
MIQAKNLEKSYGLHRALHGLSFEVAKGEVVGFLGPNGAGKTTTMRILTAFYPPSSGEAFVDGQSVLHQPEEVKKRIGYLPETPPLYKEMSVEAYLKFVFDLKTAGDKALSRGSRREAVEWAMEKCGLTHRRRSIISTLSKGYRQRVGIAQAIIHQPPVIILDEPTVGLDPIQIREIRDLISSFRGERTILLSTHTLSEVTAVCDRALIISMGKLVGDRQLGDISEKKSLEELFVEVVAKDHSGNELRNIPSVA